MAMFRRGDRVIATASEQHLVKGLRYTVKDARELFWGVVVYDLLNEDGVELSISNGYRLLTAWSPAPVKSVFDDLAVYA